MPTTYGPALVCVFTVVCAGAMVNGAAALEVWAPVWSLSPVAVLSMSPSPPPLLSRSAWVNVYEPVQTIVPKGATLPGWVGAQLRLPGNGSTMVTPVRVILPVLVNVML